MSYILEALKKAEKQRELGQVPGIESGEQAVSGNPNSRWMLMLSLIIGLNLLVLLLVLWIRSDPGPAVSLSDAEAVTTDVSKTVKPSPPKIEKVVRASAPVTPPTVVTPKAVQTPAPVVPKMAPKVVPKPALKPLPSAAAVVSITPAKKLPIQRPAAKIKKPVQSAVASNPSVPDETTSLPVWPQIPDHLYKQINKKLTLDVHVFDEKNENRFVLVNMRKYFEGDQLQEGPLLDEITQNGINLSFRGERFRVEAQ